MSEFIPVKRPTWKFTYYLHDSSWWERENEITSQGVPLDIFEKMGKPFYEVTIECEVDESGNVTIHSATP